jgi:hypothetical protein
MKTLVATALIFLHAQLAWADCAELNSQAEPNMSALKSVADHYKKSVASHINDMLISKDPPPINVISEGVAETSTVIAAMDKYIDYMRSVNDAGCNGKNAGIQSAVIAMMEAQRDEMRKNRKTYTEILSTMSKVEDKPRK